MMIYGSWDIHKLRFCSCYIWKKITGTLRGIVRTWVRGLVSLAIETKAAALGHLMSLAEIWCIVVNRLRFPCRIGVLAASTSGSWSCRPWFPSFDSADRTAAYHRPKSISRREVEDFYLQEEFNRHSKMYGTSMFDVFQVNNILEGQFERVNMQVL